MPDVSEVIITSDVFNHEDSAGSSEAGDSDIEKHICPHRKRGTLATKGLRNGDRQKGPCLQDERSKEEQSLDESGKIGAKADADCTQNVDGASESQTAKARKVQSKGNGQSRWSAKQVSKTKAIKHPDNLKSEGLFELTTTHQRDFPEKTVIDENFSADQSHAQATDAREDSWSKRQVPRTLPIKKQDNLKPSGSLDLRTTHGESYTDITPVEASLNAKQESENLSNGDRKIRKSPKQQRPKTSLRPEGQFQSETLYKKDFSPRKADAAMMTPKHRPANNLKPEGEMSFDPTSLDYNADIFQTKLENGELVSPRPRIARPQSHLKPPNVPIADETTVGSDFKNWNVEKPVRRRPEDNIKRLSGTESIDDNVMFEQIKNDTYHEDFKAWKVSRPVVKRPPSNLRSEGEFNFETTNHADYVIKEQKKDLIQENDTNINPEPVPDEKHATFQEKEQQPRMSPESEFTELKSEVPSPDILPYKESEDVSETRQNDGIASAEGSASDDMLTWDQIRPQPIRPHSNLRQHGDMTFDTTNRREFIQRPIERVKGFRPQTTTKISDDNMETSTTNQVMMKGMPGEKVNPIRPRSNLHLEEGVFNDETTSAREFQPWTLEKSKPIVHKSTLAQEGDMTFTTTHHTEFEPKSPEKVYPIRPKTTNKPNSGSFHGETTNQREFQQWGFDRMSPIRPHTNMRQEGDMDFTTMNQVQFHDKVSPRDRPQPVIHPTNLHVESGQFSNETTSQREFQEWKLAKSAPYLPKNNLTQEGDFDFTTVNQTQFFEKPIQQRREEIKPKSSSNITGDFDGTTTNQVMFKSHPYQKLKETRPRTNLHTENGKFDDDTTTKREFHEWEYSKPSPVLPHGNLMQGGDMDFTTSNQTDFGEKQIQRVEDVRPHTTDIVTGDFDGTTTNRSMFKTPPLERIAQIRHDDNLRVNSGIFNDETTAGREFVYRSSDRPDAIKPKPNLSQEGNFDFTTSNQRDFEIKPITKVSPIRPQTMTKLRDGDFYGTTTNQAMFQAATPQAVKPIRPQNNLKPQSGEFDGHTTAREEYQSWKIERPFPVVYSDTLKQEGNMQFETTNRKEFTERTTERPEPIRPKTTTKIEGDFDTTTTNQVMFPGHNLEKVHPIRQKDNLHLESGKFSDETTSKREFRQWIRAHPRTKVVKPLRAAGIRTQGISDRRQSGKKKSESESKIPEESAEGTELTSEREIEGRRDSKQEDSLKEGKAEEDEDVSENELSQKETSEKTDVQTIQKERRNGNIERKTIGKQPTRNYGSKPMARVKAIVPVGNIKSEGFMDFSTTSKTEYTEKLEQSKLDNVKIKIDHEPWKLAQDVEERFPRASRKIADIPTRPVIHKRTTMNGKDGDVPATTEVTYSAAPLIKAPKRFKPSDNLKPENVPFEGDSTTRMEYKKWDATRSSPKKRPSMLKQEGEMQFSTTAEDYSKRELFDQHGRMKPRVKKPQEHLKLTGDMTLSTTTNSCYLGNTTPKTKNLRPKSSLKIGGDDIESRTGTPPSSIRQQADLTTDITKSTYRGNVSERTRAYRPVTSQKVGEGHFGGKTTSQSEFKDLSRTEKTKPFKPESSHIFNGGSEFQGNTTYRCTYDDMKAIRCPVLDLESNDEFKFKEEVNGHRFYLPLVHG